MSRSLRSRPLTLYDNAAAPAIPPVRHDGPDVPSRSTSNQRLDQRQQTQQYDDRQYHQEPGSGGPPSASKPSSRLKKASQVGSNLKKRLSTRYADDNRRTSRMAAMGTDVLAEMPGYMTHSQRQHPRQSMQLGPPQQGGSSQQHSRGPQIGQVFDERDEDGHGDLETEYAQAYQTETSQDLQRQAYSSELLHPQLPSELGPGHVSQDTRVGAAKQSQGPKSGSSRQPTLAWEGSSLQRILDENQREGLGGIVDLQTLRRNEDFDGMDYLRLHLPPHIQPSTFSHALDTVKGAVRGDVKSQIFDNYSDFITISRQVVALENEMIELKSLLTEWRGMPRLLEREDENGKSLVSSVSSLSKRSSLVSLQQVYRAQLTSLWEGIANSQKFIPYKPGRHLIAEAPDFLELNAATYKPIKNVALFLLDDLLLVASRKKGRMSAKVKLEAERCFALGDIVVVDLKDSSTSGARSRSALANASADGATLGGGVKDSIKIKRGKEAFIYRAEKTESKKALLNAFRRVAEDLANRKKREAKGGSRGRDNTELLTTHGGADVRRQSIYAGMNFDHRSHKMSLPLAGLAEEGSGSNVDNDSDGNPDDAGVMKLASERVKEERKDPTRWLNDWSDALAVDIALRRWPDAVDKVAKGKAMLSTYTPADSVHPVMSSRLAAHTTSLVTSLLLALKSSTLRKGTLVILASHLTALGYSSIARQTFLSTREELLRKRKRSIKFEGDTEMYVSELSMVVFGMVRNTSEWFMAAWKESGMASGFVKWALAQIHSFALTFRRQVYGNSVSTSTEGGSGDSYDDKGDAAQRAREVAMESAQQLKDVGLDFTFVLRELLKTEKEQAALARAATAAVVAASQSRHAASGGTSKPRAGSNASGSTSTLRTTGESMGPPETPASAARPVTPKEETMSLPSAQASPKRRGGFIANRIADFETPSGSTPPPRTARSGAPASARPYRSTSVSSNGSAGDEVHPTTLGRSSSRGASYGTSPDAPPVPPLPSPAGGTSTSRTGAPPSSSYMLHAHTAQRGSAPSTTTTTSSSSSPPSSYPNHAPVVPSLTLTLADEASGISHRISSTDLPLITAQDIRKRQSGYHTGRSH
ncbi:unnamed protein product [Parajaminaea phylloscopi]